MCIESEVNLAILLAQVSIFLKKRLPLINIMYAQQLFLRTLFVWMRSLLFFTWNHLYQQSIFFRNKCCSQLPCTQLCRLKVKGKRKLHIIWQTFKFHNENPFIRILMEKKTETLIMPLLKINSKHALQCIWTHTIRHWRLLNRIAETRSDQTLHRIPNHRAGNQWRGQGVWSGGCSGGLGEEPPAGSRGRAPGQGAKPFEAEEFWALRRERKLANLPPC